MAHPDTGGASGALAMFAVLVLVMIASFIAWRAGMFGDRTSDQDNVTTPLHVR